MEIKRKNKPDSTEDDIDHMRRVVSYVHRHQAQKPEGDVEDSDWRRSLMNWGNVTRLSNPAQQALHRDGETDLHPRHVCRKPSLRSSGTRTTSRPSVALSFVPAPGTHVYRQAGESPAHAWHSTEIIETLPHQLRDRIAFTKVLLSDGYRTLQVRACLGVTALEQ